jgi:hypothetical protein
MQVDDLLKQINKEKPFTLMCFFQMFQDCEKWRVVQRMLNVEKVGPSKASTTQDRHPIWNKMAKAAVATSQYLKRVQSMIDKCLAKVTSGKAARYM